MTANYLICSIAKNALYSFVPANYVSVQIEHEDREISYSFDQQAEALLALAHFSLYALALLDIAKDQNHSCYLSLFISDRRSAVVNLYLSSVLRYQDRVI